MRCGRATLTGVVRNVTGPAPLSTAELLEREKIGAKVRQWRIDVGLTQEELGRLIDPNNQNPKAYIYRIEKNDGGTFSWFAIRQLCRALGHTAGELEAEIDPRRPVVPGADVDPTVTAIEAEPRMTMQAKHLAIAVVERGRQLYREETASKLRDAERRDLARQVGFDETLLQAWTRLDREQRERIAAYLVEEAARNEETPAPKGRRPPKR